MKCKDCEKYFTTATPGHGVCSMPSSYFPTEAENDCCYISPRITCKDCGRFGNDFACFTVDEHDDAKGCIGFISVDDTAENFITEHGAMKNICGAYFDENYRGNGISQGLLAFIADTLKAEGVTHLGVDCETLNPTALNFWGKYFEPYTYSFARRIDERIKM